MRLAWRACVLWCVGFATVAGAAFPPGFAWGTAIAGFQAEMGYSGGSIDTGSDWWAWVHDPANIAAHRVSGDLPEYGPGFFDRYKDHLRQAKTLRANVFRLSLEWSRIFPTSTAGVNASGGVTLPVLLQLDQLANQAAVARYRFILLEIRRRKMEPFVTLNHFALPLWLHDPIAARDALAGRDPSGPLPTGFGPAGWLDADIVPEFEKYAAYCAWKFGDVVDVWSPLNEPLVVAVNGYVNVPGSIAGFFPPGSFSFTAAIATLLNEASAHVAAYDVVKQWDTIDADRDGTAARVGMVNNMIAFHPDNPALAADVAGAVHANYLFNQVFVNAVVLGDVDANANGTTDPGEHRPEFVGKADFAGVNYYFRATARGLGAPITPVIPLLDFLPTIAYQTPHNPTAPPCPTACSEFGSEIYPEGFREVLQTIGAYGLPVIITENGIADTTDKQRPGYLVKHLQVLDRAIADGVADVRGYLYWSLMDNFEWSSGYYPRFGFFSVDPFTKKLHKRKSANYFTQIVKRNYIPGSLLTKFGQ